MWPLGRTRLERGVETVSPVIHQLATHDLLAAFLGAQDPAADVGLAGWVPERSLVRLTTYGELRPDALALIRSGERLVALFIERDLGTERGGMLADKLRRYDLVYGHAVADHPLHVGFVVESYRRGSAVRRALAQRAEKSRLGVWVASEADLRTDPFGCLWLSPALEPVRTVDVTPNRSVDHEGWPLLRPLCLTEPDALEVLDERLLDEIEPISHFHPGLWIGVRPRVALPAPLCARAATGS